MNRSSFNRIFFQDKNMYGQLDDDTKRGLELSKNKLGDIDVFVDLFGFNIAWINETIARIAGLKVEDIIGKHVSKITLLGGNEYYDFLKQSLRSDERILDVPVKASDGRTIVYKSKHYIIDLDGTPRFFAVKVLKTIEEP